MKYRLLIIFLLLMPMLLTGNIPVVQAELNDGLIAYYPFDGTAEDKSGNGNNGFEQGGLEYKMGFQGDSASFDGMDDSIRLPYNTTLNPVDLLTISFWVKVEEHASTWSPLIHKGESLLPDDNNTAYSVWVNNSSSFLLSSAEDNSEVHQVSACCAGSDWTHYIGVIDRRNHRMQVYIDGVLAQDIEDSYSTFNTKEHDLLIGWTEEDDSVHSPFKGRLDELRIYDRVLSTSEIQELSTGAKPFIISSDNTQSCSLTKLFNGSSLQVGNLLLTDWELVSATDNVNVDNIEIGRGYSAIDEFALWSNDFELQVGTWGPTAIRLDLSFDFKISTKKGGIAELTELFGNRYYSGFYYDPPWSRGEIALGTNKGSTDVGTSTIYCNLNIIKNPTSTGWISIPPELNEIWVRSTISLNSSSRGNARAGNNDYPAFRISYKENPTLIGFLGELIKISHNFNFSLVQQTHENFTLHVSNSGENLQLIKLKILNTSPQLNIEIPEQGSFEIAAHGALDIPISVDTTITSPGIYDELLLEITTADGEVLYSNLTITVIKPEDSKLPDLELRNADIRLVDYTLGKTVTLEAQIRNIGSLSATDVRVQFYEADTLLGETVLDEVVANSEMLAFINAPITIPGEHLIRVVIDSGDTIIELNEENNEANHLVTLRTPPVVSSELTIIGNLPSKVYFGELFTITGTVVYDLGEEEMPIQKAVKRGTVDISIFNDNGMIWQYGYIFTDINGKFSKIIQAPDDLGLYHVMLTISDGNLIDTDQLSFKSTERFPWILFGNLRHKPPEFKQ